MYEVVVYALQTALIAYLVGVVVFAVFLKRAFDKGDVEIDSKISMLPDWLLIALVALIWPLATFNFRRIK